VHPIPRFCLILCCFVASSSLAEQPKTKPSSPKVPPVPVSLKSAASDVYVLLELLNIPDLKCSGSVGNGEGVLPIR
jgi:hypothetical protein